MCEGTAKKGEIKRLRQVENSARFASNEMSAAVSKLEAALKVAEWLTDGRSHLGMVRLDSNTGIRFLAAMIGSSLAGLERATERMGSCVELPEDLPF